MPITADSTNSYCTVAEAQAYFDYRLHTSVWDNASTDDKNRALVWGTKQIDEHIDFYGSPYVTGQALQWPRSGMIGATGESIGYTDIPTRLKEATAEMALELLSSDVTLNSDTDGLSSLGVGPVSVTFSDSSGSDRVPIPKRVREKLSLWIRNKTSSSCVRLVRV